jgi:hypothetical protein
MRFYTAAGGGLAAGVDLRLPTGDSEQLLGGQAQLKVGLIGSMASAPFRPTSTSATPSVAVRGDSSERVTQRADEFSYASGFDTAVSSRTTISVDVTGRTLLDLGRLSRREAIPVRDTGRSVRHRRVRGIRAASEPISTWWSRQWESVSIHAAAS